MATTKTTMYDILVYYTQKIAAKFAKKTELPTKVSDLTNDSGFTTNAGTITGIKMNGSSKGTSGVVDLGTVLTSAPSNMQTTGNISQSIATDGTSTTKYPSVKAVKDAIDALPQSMVFKGSLGTNGTITTLPTASASTVGYTYKVITAGTYASQAAKAGDMFIGTKSGSNYSWTYIPSADEPSGTVTSVGGAGASNSHITVTGGAITSSGTLTVGVESGYSIPSTQWQNTRVSTDNFNITDEQIDTIVANNT